MKIITQEILDMIALGEVEAIIEGLKDPNLRTNPSFLEKVRRFLKDNKLEVVPKQVELVQQEVKELPIFDDDELV